jgi:hypothetical protein
MTPRWLPWNISFCPLPLRAHPHNIERRSPHVASTVEEQCSVETAVLGEQVYVDIPGCSRLRPSICTVCNCCPLSPTKTVLSEVDATFRIIKCCSHHFASTDIYSTKCQDLRHLLRDSWPHTGMQLNGFPEASLVAVIYWFHPGPAPPNTMNFRFRSKHCSNLCNLAKDGDRLKN